MTLKKWQMQVLANAAQHPDEPYAALARWAGIHPETLRKARRANPEFAEELERRRRGELQSIATAVGIEEFCLSSDYLGLDGKVWPVVMDELKEINSGQYDLVLLVGSIGSGKTYAAALSLLYQLYQLLLHPDPYKQYNLDPASPIILGVQNRNRRLAERNDYALCRNLIEGSPWFATNAPHDQRLKSRVKFLNKNVELWAASGDPEDLLGMNLYSLIIDEGNFFSRVERSKRSVHGGTFDAAREAFEGALRRKQSRFPDGSGCFFVASSKRYKGQFTDELAQDFVGSESTYIYDHNQWSIRPEKYADGDWFHVFVGDRLRAPHVLGKDEEIDPADRPLITSVPARFERHFRRDPVRSLQDIAGISTEVSGAFFSEKEKLGSAACLDQVLVSQSDVVGDACQLLPRPHGFNISSPDSPRAVHADLSLTGDLTGIGIGHIRRYDDRGLPEIDIDAIARVRPPRNGQIELDSVFRLLRDWKAMGIPIQWFSCDGYQSADLLQRVGRLGIYSGRLSVDQTKPNDPMAAYETLRAAISEGRLRFPDDGETVDDMLWLQVDFEKRKVDHLPNRKKDTADCLAAIAYQLTHSVQPFRHVGQIEGASGAAAVAAPRLSGQVTGVPYAGFASAMEEIRYLRSMPSR
jgi:hypothetical protein